MQDSCRIVLEAAPDLSECDQVVPVFVPVVATLSSNVKDDAAFCRCTPTRHPLDLASVTVVN